ncbi:MAG TPA: hypothetical protein VMZ33_00750 [Candidatus Limnocylindrales bacterium]|nr:hypothetical protein [Candidatus Limnocylindrales bacterium]
MKPFLAGAAAFALMGAVFAGVSMAAGPVTAQAPNARLALVVDGGSTNGSFTVLRKKGVTSVANPYVGVFCVTPSATLALGRIVPMVGVDLGGSPFADSGAAWNRQLVYCPPGTIEVETFQVSTGAHRNDVGFTLTVF